MTDGAELAPRALIVALGPGEPELVPARALAALHEAGSVAPHGCRRPCGRRSRVTASRFDEGAATVCAPDVAAHALARSLPEVPTLPERPLLARQAAQSAAGALLELTALLRRECPWDRAQTATSIVPHTVEEAYEVADAVREAGLSPKLLDELGDLLFQTTFLALLCEEAGAGAWVDVALGVAAKLRVRHPWVFGDSSADSAGDARNLLGGRQGRERGPRGHLPRRAQGAAGAARGAQGAAPRRRHRLRIRDGGRRVRQTSRASFASCAPSSARSPSRSASRWPRSSARSATSSSRA